MAPSVSLDAAMEVAEDYFESSGLRPLLAGALAKLAKEQPKDGVSAFQGFLAIAAAALREQGAEGEDVEAIDFDTLPEDSQELDPLKLVTLERLPRAKGGRGQDLSECRCWAGGFSRPLLESWLPQPSPCCAAASVAGAFNALFDFGRDHAKSASIFEVAELMAQNCDRLYVQRRERVERLLGVEEVAFAALLAALDSELLSRGFEWASSGEKAVTRAVALSTLRELLAARTPLPEDASEAAFTAMGRALGVLPVPEEVEDTSLSFVVKSEPDWEAELGELIAKRKGGMRLRHKERPNTGEIGSWGVKQAATDLPNARGCDAMNAHVLLGRKGGGKVDVAVSKEDGSEAIEQQWAALKSGFSKSNSALLFHLTNHYALIYAWREWVEDANGQDSPRARRQILTARKGQRPTVWMDFEEARSIMAGWAGYHVLQLQRTAAEPSVAGVEIGIPGGA